MYLGLAHCMLLIQCVTVKSMGCVAWVYSVSFQFNSWTFYSTHCSCITSCFHYTLEIGSILASHHCYSCVILGLFVWMSSVCVTGIYYTRSNEWLNHMLKKEIASPTFFCYLPEVQVFEMTSTSSWGGFV